MQFLYMIVIALLAGSFAAGVVWIFWENGIGVQHKWRVRREAKMMQAEDTAEKGPAKDGKDAPAEKQGK